MPLIIHTVRWKNFLSTGNAFNEVELDKHSNTLIRGKNGSGKSTFVEAISYGLYGKPIRKVNKPQLLNSVNQKGLLVEVELTSKDKRYLVRRGMKPNIFEIISDDKLINQDASIRDYQEVLERSILGMSHRTFSQVVVLGSATFVPFMQLPAHARREFIEDLLDIKIFSVMNTILKEKVQSNKELIIETDGRIALVEEKIRLGEKHIESLKKDNFSIISEKEGRLKENRAAALKCISEIEELRALLSQAEADYDDEVLTRLESRSREISRLKDQLDYRHKDVSEKLKFFHENVKCPICTQDISEDFRSSTISSYEETREKFSSAKSHLEGECSHIRDEIEKLKKLYEKVRSIRATIAQTQSTLGMLRRYDDELTSDIMSLKMRSEESQDPDLDLGLLRSSAMDLYAEKSRLLQEREVLQVASVLLKDGGIKSKIIKQYIPVINKLINKYLSDMDFFVEFTLNEQFEETIKSRHRDNFSYDSFSQGEKSRIDLALLFTWRAISKMRSASSTNLLVFDETMDSSMDEAGIDDFIQIIRDLTLDTNTFVISHRGDSVTDKFENTLTFSKVKGFSVIS